MQKDRQMQTERERERQRDRWTDRQTRQREMGERGRRTERESQAFVTLEGVAFSHSSEI